MKNGNGAKPIRSGQDFDEEFDVVVVGYGYAGSISALEAARAGAKVLVIEKTGVPGGISICSYGAVRSANNAERAFKYLKTTNGGRTPDDVVRALANGMSEVEAYVRDLARVNDAEVDTTEEYDGKSGANYPLEGFEAFYHTTVNKVPNFSAKAVYPWANGAPGGPMLFKVIEDNLAKFPIEVRYNTKALRLITAGENEVVGVTVEGKGGQSRIRARKGVVLACGGFEGNLWMQEQFWEGTPILPVAARYNTGDGIRMSQDVGAAIWHLWHFHGAYGFRHTDPTYPYAIRVKRLPDWKPGRADRTAIKMAWILLDRDGRRFMNEYQPYTQDTAHRQMHQYDPVRQLYPRIPGYIVFDENGSKLYPIGRPTSNDDGLYYEWSSDNQKEVANGVLTRANTVKELAQKLGADPAAVEASIKHWNDMCRAGADSDFGRPGVSMVPIDAPPYYGAKAWPVCSNTQGGPVHDGAQRIIDSYGDPIPRLYAAGELGSAFGHLYLSGGNIAECFVSGQIAGKNAARG